jgi:hypothetical protein
MNGRLCTSVPNGAEAFFLSQRVPVGHPASCPVVAGLVQATPIPPPCSVLDVQGSRDTPGDEREIRSTREREG